MILQPEQNSLKPFKIEIAACETVEGQQKCKKNGGPFPADNLLPPLLDKKHYRKNIRAGSGSQTGKHQHPSRGGRGKLKIPELFARRRRQADEQEH